MNSSPDSGEGREALVLLPLRIPAGIKSRWVRESRAAGQRLTDWIITHVEASMKTVSAHSPLKLRLSNGRSWAWEFTARDADELAQQCLEGWAQCPLRPRPASLELHISDPEASPPMWVPAGYGSGRFVRNPAMATERANWSTADWSAFWTLLQETSGKLRQLEIFLGAADGFSAAAIDSVGDAR